MNRNRRQATALALAAPWAWGAASAAPMKALGLFSVLGDFVDVSLHEDPSASRMDRANRQTLQVGNVGFDRLVAAEVKRHMTQWLPSVHLHAFSAGAGLTAPQQKRLSDDARRGALPGFVIDRIQEMQLSHALLITRNRMATSLVTANKERIGRGEVEGLGFYIDPTYRVVDPPTGNVTTGALGPHVLVTLTLFDVDSAKVVAEGLIDRQWLVGAKPSQRQVAPWDYMTPQEKLVALRDALQEGLRDQLPAVLKPGN